MAARATRAIALRALADARTRTISFAVLFAGLAYATVAGYHSTYPSAHDRLEFARDFGDNKAVRLFYGVPHDLVTDGGYAAWRVAGVLSIFAALWALLTTTKALRGEEDTGRQELVLARTVSRRSAYLAVLTAIGTGGAALWLALWVGLLGAQLSAGGAAQVALATVLPMPVFAGVGALTSQLAPTRQVATGLAAGALLVAFALRVIADTSTDLDWLRWATPLGWTEELRAYVDPRPAVAILPIATGAALLAGAGAIFMRRDVGAGLLPARDRRSPRLWLLGSPTTQALRGEVGFLAGWLVGVGAFALILGVVADSVTSAKIPESARKQIAKFSDVSITAASGYLGFTFLFFVLAVSLFSCSQVAAIRREEAAQRLETLLSLPVSRAHWLAGRVLLAVGSAAVLGLSAGVLSWVGAASQGADVSLPRLLEAGANCMPASILFLGVGVLAFAAVPSASSGISYGLVSTGFVWELFGALLNAPKWALGLSPFHHVALVPAEDIELTPALTMSALGAGAVLAALVVFRRRDLAGA